MPSTDLGTSNIAENKTVMGSTLMNVSRAWTLKAGLIPVSTSTQMHYDLRQLFNSLCLFPYPPVNGSIREGRRN